MQSLTKISFGLMVISFAGLAGLSRLSYADDCEAKYNGLTDEQRVMFNIEFDAWVPASTLPPPLSTLPAHAFIGGCHNCAGASYSPTGVLLNSSDLNKIPT